MVCAHVRDRGSPATAPCARQTQRTEKFQGKEGKKKSEFVRQIGIRDGIGDQEDQILAGMLGQCSSLAVLSSTHNRFDDPRNHIRCGRVGI